MYDETKPAVTRALFIPLLTETPILRSAYMHVVTGVQKAESVGVQNNVVPYLSVSLFLIHLSTPISFEKRFEKSFLRPGPVELE